jgi:hypothetical protein
MKSMKFMKTLASSGGADLAGPASPGAGYGRHATDKTIVQSWMVLSVACLPYPA